jgi:diguanylate cyclase (GGDEF)-like protein
LEIAVSIKGNGELLPQARDDSRYTPLTQTLTAGQSCRVLVVDDDPLMRTHLAALLNASQYQVELAATAEEALRIMDTAHCNIVLTDWQMPDMDGLALCRQVRHKIQQSYVYVLMLTIRNTEHDVLAALTAGADAYVVKGTPIDEILARVETGRRISHGEYTPQTRNRDASGLSDKDPVTGARSLNYLMYHLPRELSRSQRHGHALAVLNCEIDGFDRFQDRFGHEAGDEQLRSFVTRSEGCIRKGDWLARTIGDSFMIVLPETAATGAHRAAQKLRALFALHSLSTPNEPIGFTVSIEVTAVEGKHDADSTAQLEVLLRAAKFGTHTVGRPIGERADRDITTFAVVSGARGRGGSGLN